MYVAGSCGLFKNHLQKKGVFGYEKMNPKHIGLCRVSIHVVYVKKR